MPTNHRVDLGLPLVMDLPTATKKVAPASYVHPLPPPLASCCGGPGWLQPFIQHCQGLPHKYVLTSFHYTEPPLNAFWLTTMLIFHIQIAASCRSRRHGLLPFVAREMAWRKPTTAAPPQGKAEITMTPINSNGPWGHIDTASVSDFWEHQPLT